jgi:hypothetical protein
VSLSLNVSRHPGDVQTERNQDSGPGRLVKKVPREGHGRRHTCLGIHSVCVCMYVCVCICMCMCVRVCMCMCMRMRMRMRMCVWM